MRRILLVSLLMLGYGWAGSSASIVGAIDPTSIVGAICKSPLQNKPPLQETPTRQGKDFALFFAVNRYDRLDDLSKPISDAKKLAAELEESYGFDTEVVKNPTIDQIDAKISAYQRAYRQGSYDQGGQLLIFFSGHGITAGANGYFMAKDSDPARPQRTAIEYDYYRNQIDQINCQHILVAIDACHSATFDPNFSLRTDRRFRRKGEETFDRVLANHDSYTARCFWTSDGVGKETPDRSNFAYHLLEGLRNHRSETGYLRSSELFSLYLEKAAPEPGGGRFGQDDPSACFLFFREGPQRKSDRQAFLEALDCGTVACLRAFIEDYPESSHVAIAQKSLDEKANRILSVKSVSYNSGRTSFLYLNCLNQAEIFFEQPLGDSIRIESSDAIISDYITHNNGLSYHVNILPQKSSCRIQIKNGEAEHEQVLSIAPPPKPSIKLYVGDLEYNGLDWISKTSQLSLKVEPDAAFASHLPEEAVYKVASITVNAQLSLGPPTTVYSAEGGIASSKPITFRMGSRVEEARPGTNVKLLIGQVTRVNSLGEEILEERFSDIERTIVFNVK